MSDVEFDLEQIEEIPSAIELTEAQEEELVRMIAKAYQDVNSGRAEAHDKWAKWKRQREGRSLHEGPKDTPYPNSSNIMPPVSTIVTNTIYGKTQQVFNQKSPFWVMKAIRQGTDPQSQRDHELAEFGARYMNMISDSPLDLDLRNKQTQFHYEANSLGTAVVHVPWLRDVRIFKSVEADGSVRERRMVLHDGPVMEQIALEDFYYPGEFSDLQIAPWVFFEVHLPWHVIESRGVQGAYQDWERLRNKGRFELRGYEMAERQRAGDAMQIGGQGLFDLVTGYMYYDVDGDGIWEDLKFTMHLESETILRIEYNDLGIRPIDAMRHLKRPNHLEGMGVGWLTEQMQDEIQTIHNHRIDNMKLANTRMLAVRKNAGLRPKERIYPGKMLFLNNPREDVFPIQLGEIYPSSLQAEDRAMQYAQRATGASDIMGGFADSVAKSGDSVGGQILRLEQGEGIHNIVIQGMEESYMRLGMFVFFQLVANKEVVIENENKLRRLSDEDLGKLGELLDIPVEEIPQRMVFMIRTAKSHESFDVMRQNYTTLVQLYSMYSEKVMPLIMMLYGPEGQQMPMEAKQFALKVLIGSSSLMDKVFAMFGEDNEDQYLDDMQREKLLYELTKAMQAPMLDMMRMQLEGGLHAGTGTGAAELGRVGADQSGSVERGAAAGGGTGGGPAEADPGMAGAGGGPSGVSAGGVF